MKIYYYVDLSGGRHGFTDKFKTEMMARQNHVKTDILECPIEHFYLSTDILHGDVLGEED